MAQVCQKEQIHVKFDPTSNDIANADADKMIITMNPKKMENNSHTINGTFDHEVTHLAQEYPPHIYALYQWLVEGIADYARKKYGPKNDGWSLPRPKRGDKYADGYGVAARFLVWLEKKKSPRIVDELHERLQRGTFTMDDFRHLTGQSMDELWVEYESCPALEKLDSRMYNSALYKLEVGKHDPAFDHLANRVQTHFKKVYPDLFKRFVDPCRAEGKQEIHLELDPDHGSAASTIDDKRIVLGPKHLGPDAVQAEGQLTWALANLVYSYPNQPGDAAWLMQGMADYARHTYGLKNDTWALPRLEQGDNFTDGGGVAARFLVWLEKNKSQSIVDALHDRLQRGTFTMDDFRHITGQSVDELWVEYESCPALEKLDSRMYNSALYKLEVGKHDPAFDHLANRVQTHFKKVYPDLFKRFVDPCRADKVIHLELDPDHGSTASTIDDKRIVLGPKHLGPDAVQAEGQLTWALANLVYNYPNQPGDAAWLMQGMADYARHTYGLKNDTWALPRLEQGDNYTDGCGVAARFLVWLEKNKGDHIVDNLNRLLQSRRFTAPDFLRLTRQTVDELWEEYHSNQLANQQSEDRMTQIKEQVIIGIVGSIVLGYGMYKIDAKLNKVVKKRKSVDNLRAKLTSQCEDLYKLAVRQQFSLKVPNLSLIRAYSKTP